MSQIHSPHRQSIDLARFVAALGVVMAHALASVPSESGQMAPVGHVSLGLFLILTAFLAVQSAERAGGRYDWIARVPRLAVPWLFWSAFFRLLDELVFPPPGGFHLLSDPWTLLIGSTIHLWFLPFVMLAMVLVQPVARLVSSARRLGLALGLFVLVSVPLFAAHGALPLPEPLAQWSYALPLYGYGLLLAPAHRLGRAGWPLLAMAALTLLAVPLSGAAAWAFAPLGAALVFEGFWRLPLRHRWLPGLGRVAFGIYLMHPFFVLFAFKAFGPDAHWLIQTVFGFGLSWLAAAVMLRLPLVNRVV